MESLYLRLGQSKWNGAVVVKAVDKGHLTELTLLSSAIDPYGNVHARAHCRVASLKGKAFCEIHGKTDVSRPHILSDMW